MLLLAKFIGKILSVLNSEENPKQVAAGFAFGAWIGLLPLKGLLPPVFTLLSFLININLAFLALAAAIYKVLSFALDPISNYLGLHLLTKVPGLTDFWTHLYNMPVVPFTRFNNTLVLGNLVMGFLLLVPNYFIGLWFVKYYRANLRGKVEQWKIMKMIKATNFYRYYENYRNLRGE